MDGSRRGSIGKRGAALHPARARARPPPVRPGAGDPVGRAARPWPARGAPLARRAPRPREPSRARTRSHRGGTHGRGTQVAFSCGTSRAASSREDRHHVPLPAPRHRRNARRGAGPGQRHRRPDRVSACAACGLAPDRGHGRDRPPARRERLARRARPAREARHRGAARSPPRATRAEVRSAQCILHARGPPLAAREALPHERRLRAGPVREPATPVAHRPGRVALVPVPAPERPPRAARPARDREPSGQRLRQHGRGGAATAARAGVAGDRPPAARGRPRDARVARARAGAAALLARDDRSSCGRAAGRDRARDRRERGARRDAAGADARGRSAARRRQRDLEERRRTRSRRRRSRRR